MRINHPKQILFFLLFFVSLAAHSQTAADTLIVMSNQKLYKVNRNNAGVSLYLDIVNHPGFDPISLDWSEPLHSYYGIEHSIGNTIFKISETGLYTSLGTVTVPGFTISTIEGIAFNPLDNELYASVSLNGGPSQGDYCSETLIKIDLATMEGENIGTFFHPLTSALEPEADAIEFDEQGILYYFDCSVNSDNRIFKQDLAFASSPVLLNQTSYWPLSDITVRDDQIYTLTSTANIYNLQKCSVNGGPLEQIAISPGAVFSSSSLRGITWKNISNTSTTAENATQLDSTEIILPNVFTPNGDNVNDLFYLNVPNAVNIQMNIQNRWGNEMIELEGLHKSWDGTVNGDPVSEGVYFYTYEITFKNNKRRTGQGFVTLIR